VPSSHFFRCLQYPEIFVLSRQTIILETARSNSKPNQGKDLVFLLSNRLLGQKLSDRERLVSCSIVKVENPIVGPNFRHSFYAQLHVTTSVFPHSKHG